MSPGELLPGETCCPPLRRRAGWRSAALQSLQQSGLDPSRQGLGAVVLPLTSDRPGLDRFASLESLAGETSVGWERELRFAPVLPTEEWLEGSRSRPESRCSRCAGQSFSGRSGGLGGGHAAALGPAGRPDPGDHLGIRGLVLLLKKAEEMVAYADAKLEPWCGSTIARRLGTRPRSAAMFVEVVLHDVAGTPVAISRAWMRPEFFRFAVRRRRSRGE